MDKSCSSHQDESNCYPEKDDFAYSHNPIPAAFSFLNSFTGNTPSTIGNRATDHQRIDSRSLNLVGAVYFVLAVPEAFSV
jgi:hypothetical protein